MNKLITTNDFFLTKYKIEETKEKIVYLIPSGIEIDFIGNRKILLNKFKDVIIDINSKDYNKKITCLKKHNEYFIYLDSKNGRNKLLFSIKKEKLEMRLFTENYNRFDNTGNVTFGHACIGSLMKANIIKPEYMKNTEMITVIRNPYDRFVSLFNDYKRTGRIPPNFTQFDFANTLRTMKRKPGLYNSIEFSMCANQSDWIIGESIIIPIEELSGFVKDIYQVDLPTLNCSENNILDENCRDIVGELYNKDFCLLPYE